jgi:hypothetical protein
MEPLMSKFRELSLVCAAAALAVAIATPPAQASTIGLDFAPASTINSQPELYNYNLGWEFETNGVVEVSMLGTWDAGSLSNLSTDYQIGLWNCGTNPLVACTTGNSLVASATIDPSSPGSVLQLGQWAFIAITPVFLNAATFYAIGSQGGDGVDITSPDNFSSGDDVNVDPDITYENDLFLYVADSLTLSEPVDSEGYTSPSTDASYFGANLELGPLTIPVPEPGSLALFGSALAGLGLVLRRRRKLA